MVNRVNPGNQSGNGDPQGSQLIPLPAEFIEINGQAHAETACRLETIEAQRAADVKRIVKLEHQVFQLQVCAIRAARPSWRARAWSRIKKIVTNAT